MVANLCVEISSQERTRLGALCQFAIVLTTNAQIATDVFLVCLGPHSAGEGAFDGAQRQLQILPFCLAVDLVKGLAQPTAPS